MNSDAGPSGVNPVDELAEEYLRRRRRGEHPTVSEYVARHPALAAEILEAYQGQGNAIRKRDEVHKMAQANKAFAHFRW